MLVSQVLFSSFTLYYIYLFIYICLEHVNNAQQTANMIEAGQ